MDADYGRNRDRDGTPTRAFEPSLVVWSTVMSRPAEDRAIVDAGFSRAYGCGSCSLRRDTGLTLMSASCWRACARS